MPATVWNNVTIESLVARVRIVCSKAEHLEYRAMQLVIAKLKEERKQLHIQKNLESKQWNGLALTENEVEFMHSYAEQAKDKHISTNYAIAELEMLEDRKESLDTNITRATSALDAQGYKDMATLEAYVKQLEIMVGRLNYFTLQDVADKAVAIIGRDVNP
jgi:hypothetical protein